MNVGADIVFKNRDPQKIMFERLRRIGKNSVTISASGGDLSIDLFLDTRCLKELALMLNEFLFRGCDISNLKRMEGMESGEAQVNNCHFSLAGESLTIQVEDSQDVQYSDFILAMTTKGGERISFNVTVKQAKDIIKVLKQFVLSHELNKRAHQGMKASPAPNPA